MVHILNCRNWVLLPLVSISIVLAVLVDTSHATRLKDIRVGEYPHFTRIVFEMDAPTRPAKIELQAEGRLAVIFSHTSADLIRRIPLERSPHVKNLQIWEKGSQLTAVLAFDFHRFNHKSFVLNAPPRLVLDIHPLADTSGTAAATTPKFKSDESKTTHAAPTQASEPAGGEGDIPRGASSRLQEPHADQESNAPLSGDRNGHRMPGEKTGNKASAAKVGEKPQTGPATPQAHELTNNSVKAIESSPKLPRYTGQPSAKRPSRLQYFLVIFLVFITIAILVLLLLMLAVKHAWIENRYRPKPIKKPESRDKPMPLPGGKSQKP
jgi:hypothetical protein